MEERTYKLMGRSGAMNMAFGICLIVAGITFGVLFIVSGAKLLSGRNRITF